MFSAPIKTILCGAAIAVLAAGCIGKSSKEDEIKRQAESVLSQAHSQFDSGRYEEALELLDSIDRSYAEAVETRKAVSRFRPEVMERLSARELSVTDSLLAVNSIYGDSLRRLTERVSNPIEGYYVASVCRGVDVRATAGLHSRISLDNHFYLTAMCPTKGKATAVVLEVGDDCVRSAEIYPDGERNEAIAAGRIITLTEQESDPLARFVAEHSGQPITMRFYDGTTPTGSVTLTPQQTDAVATLYGLVTSINQDWRLRIEKERLNKQLETARMQIASMAE